MKLKTCFAVSIFAVLLAACTPSTPPPSITATPGNEFTLTPGQTAFITDADVSITFINISGDERCPSKIECAMSGPVTLSISVTEAGKPAEEYSLQTFTSVDGHAPEMEFEGIENRLLLNGYLIRVVKILPYPETLEDPIAAQEYRATFMVTIAE